jgi:hypothetical protein
MVFSLISVSTPAHHFARTREAERAASIGGHADDQIVEVGAGRSDADSHPLTDRAEFLGGGGIHWQWRVELGSAPKDQESVRFLTAQPIVQEAAPSGRVNFFMGGADVW